MKRCWRKRRRKWPKGGGAVGTVNRSARMRFQALRMLTWQASELWTLSQTSLMGTPISTLANGSYG